MLLNLQWYFKIGLKSKETSYFTITTLPPTGRVSFNVVEKQTNKQTNNEIHIKSCNIFSIHYNPPSNLKLQAILVLISWGSMNGNI